jgi:hypothetical protein
MDYTMAFMRSASMSLLSQSSFSSSVHHDQVSASDMVIFFKVRLHMLTASSPIFTAIPEIQVSLAISTLICLFPWPSDHRARKAQAMVPQQDGREASVPQCCATFDAGWIGG